MSFTQFLSLYVSLNLLLFVGFLGLAVFAIVASQLHRRIESASELRLHYGAVLVVLVFAVLHSFFPAKPVFEPAAKVWAAPSIQSFGDDYQSLNWSGYLTLPSSIGASTLKAENVSLIWGSLGLILLIVSVASMVRDILQLARMKRRSFVIRKIGNVSVLANDEIQVPFSYWLPRSTCIVLPISIMNSTRDAKIAIAHEIQHHRQGDTRMIYVFWMLRQICIINPAVHLWNRWITEIQEYACDETLVDRKKVEAQAYARCLVEVAQTAIHQRSAPVCATGLTLLTSRNFLHRRIKKMLSQRNEKLGRSIGIAFGACLALALGVTAYATNGLVQDRRVNMAQAKVMAQHAQSESGFPVVVNEQVLKQLNRYIGTPEGRDFMKESLARMENDKVIVSEALKKYGVPSEIMAVPLIESGYQNLSEKTNSNVKSAGIWQFIPQTARNYGLKVDAKTDERLDVGLLTDAAMRYLQANRLRFKDWQLSMLSFNMGEDAVQKGINAVGTRDAWELIRNGCEGDKDYLAKLMAAILIMRNPESVQ